MTRNVMCRKFGKELPGLPAPPLPGPKGLEIYEHVSQDAWQQWLQHQTRLINEKHLNMLEPESRTYLADQMTRFLSGESYDAAEGYVPESDK